MSLSLSDSVSLSALLPVWHCGVKERECQREQSTPIKGVPEPRTPETQCDGDTEISRTGDGKVRIDLTFSQWTWSLRFFLVARALLAFQIPLFCLTQFTLSTAGRAANMWKLAQSGTKQNHQFVAI